MTYDLFIVDAHEDIAFHINYFKRDFVNPELPCMITLPSLKEGNIRLVFNTIFVHPKSKPHKTLEKALEQFSIYENIYKEHNKDITPIRDLNDLSNLEKSNKIGFLTLMEGADPIQEPDSVKEFYDRGVRILGLAWNDRNKYASGTNTDSGITEKGFRLIEKMNELSITLDLSHLNKKGFWQAIKAFEHIPIASHSNARRITDNPRNLDDDQLKAISERGGVIGVVLYNNFLKTSKNPTSLQDVFLHTDYIVKICGEDHVGIGSDLDGARIKDFPKELRKIEDIKKIADYFQKKGYSIARIKKIMGGNFLRILRKNLNEL